MRIISRLNGWPARSPVNASPHTSRYAAHDSGGSGANSVECRTPQQPLKRQKAVGAFWRTDHAFQASIRISNDLAVAALTVVPVLYMADGTQYTLSAVKIPKRSIATVSINEALAAAPPEIASHISTYGSATLRYVWRWQAAVSASILSLDLLRSLTYTTRFIAPSAVKASQSKQVVEGLWWLPYSESSSFLSMYNNSDQPLEALLESFDERGRTLGIRQESIQPRSTKVLDITDSPAVRIPKSVGGLRVSYTAESRALILNGGIEDPARGYSAALPLMSASMAMSSTPTAQMPRPLHSSFASVGVMIGKQDPMMGFPRGTTFQPYVFLRNIGNEALTVNPAVNFSQDGPPKTVDLPSITLGPSQSSEMHVGRLLHQAGVHGIQGQINLTFEVNAGPGSLLATTGSVDQSGNYVFEVEPSALQTTTTKQISFWSVADVTSSQHTYPNSPLGGPCRVSTCFDCIVNSRTRATHQAQDVAQPTVGALQVGAPIYAAEGGTVAAAEGGHPHASSDAATCAGQHYAANFVWISDGHGAITKYVHVSPTVTQGATIAAGQQIGTVDISGCSTGAHTHISRKLNGATVNFTLPCDNSHFDPAANWIDDTDQ